RSGSEERFYDAIGDETRVLRSPRGGYEFAHVARLGGRAGQLRGVDSESLLSQGTIDSKLAGLSLKKRQHVHDDLEKAEARESGTCQPLLAVTDDQICH
ncbi:hypothetical protein Dimus_036356, partial [Dionaea muscipula]